MQIYSCPLTNIQPRIATDDELMLIHKYDYVEAIKHASHGIISERLG